MLFTNCMLMIFIRNNPCLLFVLKLQNASWPYQLLLCFYLLVPIHCSMLHSLLIKLTIINNTCSDIDNKCTIKLQFTEKENLKKSYICKTYRSATKITPVMLSLKITFFWTVAFSVLNILKNHKSWCLKEDVQYSLIVCHHLDWCF